jgi:isoquinoline 1-oxidoreductase alpha subunit
MATTLTVNGKTASVDAAPNTPLLWVLRDDLKLTGTKYGCGAGLCGACSVHVDGALQRSCQLTLADVVGKQVRTIDGLDGKVGAAVQKAWVALDVVQCGYCQSGQVMAAVALLTTNPKPTDADIDAAMDINVCRCATYHRIRAGIHAAAKTLEG